MVFSGNVRVSAREEIMTLWGATQSHQYEKYLGLPPFIRRSRKRILRNKRKTVATSSFLERQTIITRRQGSINQIRGPCNSNLCHEQFQVPKNPLL